MNIKFQLPRKFSFRSKSDLYMTLKNCSINKHLFMEYFNISKNN